MSYEMKKVTKTEYYARFMNEDAVISVPCVSVAEWSMRYSRAVIARSIDRASEDANEPYTVTDYFISE
jgi:hypothetical protein